MSERKPYPSDLSDARWALIEPTLTAWRKARLERRPTGQLAKVELRDAFDALLYINRTGIPWKYLPHDFPGHGTVYFYYAAWRDEGILAQLNYDLTGLAPPGLRARCSGNAVSRTKAPKSVIGNSPTGRRNAVGCAMTALHVTLQLPATSASMTAAASNGPAGRARMITSATMGSSHNSTWKRSWTGIGA